jgi:hypothetical protein
MPTPKKYSLLCGGVDVGKSGDFCICVAVATAKSDGMCGNHRHQLFQHAPFAVKKHMAFFYQAKTDPLKRRAFNEQLRFSLYEQIKSGMEAEHLEWTASATEAYGEGSVKQYEKLASVGGRVVGAKRRVIDEVLLAKQTALKRVRVNADDAIDFADVLRVDLTEEHGGSGAGGSGAGGEGAGGGGGEVVDSDESDESAGACAGGVSPKAVPRAGAPLSDEHVKRAAEVPLPDDDDDMDLDM